MNTARDLSGAHLGKRVTIDGDVAGVLVSVEHEAALVTDLRADGTREHLVGRPSVRLTILTLGNVWSGTVPPLTPVTFEEIR